MRIIKWSEIKAWKTHIKYHKSSKFSSITFNTNCSLIFYLFPFLKLKEAQQKISLSLKKSLEDMWIDSETIIICTQFKLILCRYNIYTHMQKKVRSNHASPYMLPYFSSLCLVFFFHFIHNSSLSLSHIPYTRVV